MRTKPNTYISLIHRYQQLHRIGPLPEPYSHHEHQQSQTTHDQAQALAPAASISYTATTTAAPTTTPASWYQRAREAVGAVPGMIYGRPPFGGGADPPPDGGGVGGWWGPSGALTSWVPSWAAWRNYGTGQPGVRSMDVPANAPSDPHIN